MEVFSKTLSRCLRDKEAAQRATRLRGMEIETRATAPEADATVSRMLSPCMQPQAQGLTELGPDVLYDLEMFRTYKEPADTKDAAAAEPCLLDVVAEASFLTGSRHWLRFILEHPIHSPEQIRLRQRALQRLEPWLTSDAYASDMTKLKEVEADMLWLIETRDPQRPMQGDQKTLSGLLDIVYFNNILTRMLNQSEWALTAHNTYRMFISPAMGLLSPLIYFVLPYLILRFKIGLAIPFLSYLRFIFKSMFSSSFSLFGSSHPWVNHLKYLSYALTFIFYFQGIFNSFDIAQATYKVSRLIVKRVNQLMQFLQISQKWIDQAWSDPEMAGFGWVPDAGVRPLPASIAEISESMFWTTSYGKHLKTFRGFTPGDVVPRFVRLYLLDALAGVLRAQQHHQWSYAMLAAEPEEGAQQRQRPILDMQGMRHPALCKKPAVPNDLSLSNLVLTGPNAGGKSTLIKGIVSNVLMCQTFGLGAFRACRWTPFHYITTQITIPDCKGKESLFEAEMHRCKRTLDALERHREAPCLVALDEIFNSTNPIEGISGAFAVGMKLASYDQVIGLITTHFVYLTRLAKETRDRASPFVNYKMNVRMDPDKIIHYPYKIARGISRQTIALELLRLHGFDQELLEEANRVRVALTQSRAAEKA